jgi:hypothetical protein
MQDDILRKIRGLLKLGESDNPNEAASAAAMAARLMERHSIEAAALEIKADQAEPDEPLKEFKEPLGKSGSWRYRLADALATANGCLIYKTGSELRIAGRASGAEKVRYLFAYCEREIDRLARRNTRGEGRTYANNYRIGCVGAIKEAIAEERAALRAEMRTEAEERDSVSQWRPGPSALVAVDNAIARVDRQTEEASAWAFKTLRLRTSRGSSSRSNPSARSHGRADGAGVYPGNGGGSIGSGARQLGRG